jgi:tousled-like kinase
LDGTLTHSLSPLQALRVEEERKCHFKKFGVVHERYVLCKLLGFGGFSQVYLAYDLHEMAFVAVKYHFLRPGMSSAARDQYVFCYAIAWSL